MPAEHDHLMLRIKGASQKSAEMSRASGDDDLHLVLSLNVFKNKLGSQAHRVKTLLNMFSIAARSGRSRSAGVPAGWLGCVSLPHGELARVLGYQAKFAGFCPAGSETQPGQPAGTPAFRRNVGYAVAWST